MMTSQVNISSGANTELKLRLLFLWFEKITKAKKP